ncbi:MAG TPA: hypothetical protein VG320_23175 [Paraburkholderia sp.]|jgi:hypothetical protein|uniref:hypothetical protein n=1 Tax=Paraburkholderia sp. TaxID=1926495 RepID=UPI002DF31A02|nr:hypothetical protein [Paraburkholderia sp.]
MGVALVPAALGRMGGERAGFKPLTSNPYELQVLKLMRTGEIDARVQGFAGYLGKG